MPVTINGKPLRRSANPEPLLGEPLETLPMPHDPAGPFDADPRPYGANTDPETGSYLIGRGRPPSSGQIKPGEVRNRRGRGKGTKNRATLFREAFDTPISVTVKGRKEHRTPLELSYRQLSTMAAKGDLKAIDLAERIRDKLIGLENDNQRVEEPLSEEEMAILRRRGHGS